MLSKKMSAPETTLLSGTNTQSLPLPNLAAGPKTGQVQIEGIVTSRLFASPDSDFAVVRLEPPSPQPAVVAVGALLGVHLGETVRLFGRYEQHARFGERFVADQVLPVVPETVRGVERYLATLDGLGPELARRIISTLGETLGPQALKILEEQTFRISQIKGIGKKRAARALADALRRQDERQVMVFLQGLGISATYAAKIRKTWGQAAIARLRENPYALCREVRGIGFHVADQIAQALGLQKHALARCVAGVRHALQLGTDMGHCFLPEPVLRAKAAKLLFAEPTNGPNGPDNDTDLACEKNALAIEQAIETLRSHRETTHEGEAVYLSALHGQELELCEQVKRLLSSVRKRVPHFSQALDDLSLARGQTEALAQTERSPLSIITGGPGTGKTTIISALCRAYLRAGLRVVLSAPTGRAAKRLSDATQHPAKTIHRLLSLVPGETEHTGRDVEADLLVCDEASMLDLPLAVALLQAIPSETTVVIVGDVDQLPSVGPGRVLADLIDSGCVPVTRLTEVFRQAEGSGIIHNARAILNGELPQALPSEGKPPDFFWIEVQDARTVQERVVKLVCQRIPQRFGFHPLSEIQVLTPMHRGETGTVQLNRCLQAALNPAATTQAADGGPARFFVGDKVMQVRNNYELDVWNGDIGVVAAHDEEEDLVLVRFDDDRQVAYDAEAREDLELAYAVSVHKSQGSEYQAVVIPLHLQHFALLVRNLLYTAVTRGKKLVVLVGGRQAVQRAVRQTGDLQRHTGLLKRLRSILPGT